MYIMSLRYSSYSKPRLISELALLQVHAMLGPMLAYRVVWGVRWICGACATLATMLSTGHICSCAAVFAFLS